jgi:hypothetical protein
LFMQSSFDTTRAALLRLHRHLLDAQRVEVERIGGRMTGLTRWLGGKPLPPGPGNHQ